MISILWLLEILKGRFEEVSNTEDMNYHLRFMSTQVPVFNHNVIFLTRVSIYRYSDNNSHYKGMKKLGPQT